MTRSAIIRRQLLALAEDAILYQEAPGQFTEDGYVAGQTVSTIIRVSGQPMTEAVAAQVLPEGTRIAGSFRFYVLPSENVMPLRTGDFPTGRDIIRYREINYRASSAQPWAETYTVVYATREETQDGPPPSGARARATSGDDFAESGSQRAVS